MAYQNPFFTSHKTTNEVPACLLVCLLIYLPACLPARDDREASGVITLPEHEGKAITLEVVRHSLPSCPADELSPV